MSLTLKKVRSNLERVLDKNLQDLVRGIRSHKNNEAKYISQCLEEIKLELRQENVAVKANAIAKLTYLQMLGYDISWAAFNIIEVMSSPKFTYKRVAYLAASQCFHKDLDVLMLATNLLRKDLNSHNYHDIGLAITSLSCFITPDLARDLGNDVITLMNSTKPYIRKKAVLLMYKVFLNHPDALRSAFPRLREKLEDPDPGVQSAAVHVICELARRNPQNYLPLAPTFFKLMTSSVNNWVLIKIIKLFGALTPIEPRLGKKLLEPLTNLIHSTSAMSLLYECIQTVIQVLLSITKPTGENGMDAQPEHASAIQLCVQKLRVLIEDSDQNLKYLGLLAMAKILEAHPKPVQAHKDLILACLDDRDESIRLRALDLLHGMVSRKNLVEITKKLISHAEKAEGSHYRDEIVSKVIGICSQSNYQYVTNFEWYLSVLIELSRLQGMKQGQAIAAQLLDVAIRVSAVRPFAVQQMDIIIQNNQTFLTQSSLQQSGSCEVLYAAAWICGEFSSYLPRPVDTLEAMLTKRTSQLPHHIQSVYLQNAAKIYSRVLKQKVEEKLALESENGIEENDGENEQVNGKFDPVKHLNQLVRKALQVDFVQSSDLEVQERASCFQALIDFIDASNGKEKMLSVVSDLAALFDGELNPVAPKAQKKVPIPEGLDLDKWINEPPPPEVVSPVSSSESETRGFGSVGASEVKKSESSSPVVQLSKEELRQMKEKRLASQEANPHYLKSSTKQSPSMPRISQMEGLKNLEIAKAPESSESLLLKSSSGIGYAGGSNMTDSFVGSSNPMSTTKKGKKSKKGKKKSAIDNDDEDDVQPNVVVSTNFDMPEGADLSDGESKGPLFKGKSSNFDDDMHRRLADINLDQPAPVVKEPPPSVSKNDLKISGAEDRGDVAVNGDKKKKKKGEKSAKGVKKGTKSKKSKKSDLVEETAIGTDLIGGNEENSPMVETRPPPEQGDDLDYWLSPTEPAPEPTQEQTPEKKKKGSKKEKVKKGKKSKEPVSSPEAKTAVTEDLASILGSPAPAPDRSEYEEADSGSNTPGMAESNSGEQFVTVPIPTGFSVLSENSQLRFCFQAKPDDSDDDLIVVTTCLQNLSKECLIKEFELSILDAPGGIIMLHRTKKFPNGIVKMPPSVAPGQQANGSFTLKICEGAMNALPRLRGTLTYIAKAGSSAAKQDQLEFRFSLPPSAFVYPEPYSNADSLQQLMTSGMLTEREGSTAATSKSGVTLENVSKRIANGLHLTIVERPGGASSNNSVAMHGRTIGGDHLCLLLKQQSDGQGYSIDARSSQNAKTFLGNFVAEIVSVITTSRW